MVSTVLPLTTRPASAQFVLSALMKRTFDIVVSLTGIVLFSPLLILVAMLIKASSPGPVFYLGSRAGRRGTPFDIWKFRTMIVDAEAVGGSATASDDPRITRIGRVLRKHKVDELPQLLNVLRGDMSFVGPRPEVTDYVDLKDETVAQILEIKPGITDWASIWDSDEGGTLAGLADPERFYLDFIRPVKTQLQYQYVMSRSFSVDMKILCCTLFRMVNKHWLPRELMSWQDTLRVGRQCCVPSRKGSGVATECHPGAGALTGRVESS